MYRPAAVAAAAVAAAAGVDSNQHTQSIYHQPRQLKASVFYEKAKYRRLVAARRSETRAQKRP